MFCALYAPNFPVQAALRAEPGLRSHALAILDGEPPLERVFAMNEFARQSGVQFDMSRALLEQCAAVAIRPRSPEQESAAHAALLAAARDFSPRVEETAADTLTLDLTGMESLFGPLEKIATDLKRRVAACWLEARIAIAANADAANAAARGFSGITIIPAGREAQALARLPLAALCGAGFSLRESNLCDSKGQAEVCPTEILETLERWGIRTCGALAALPTAQLSERLGQAGVRLQLLARGAAERSLRCDEAPPEFSAAIELEYPVEELEPLAFLLGRLLDEVCARLSEHALATNELRVRMELDTAAAGENASTQRRRDARPNGESTFERTLALPVPMRDSKLLLNLLRLHLAAHPPPAPITKVFIAAAPARGRTAQGGFFVPRAPDPQKLEVTLARIAAVVGEGNVGSAELLNTHRPGAFRMNRFLWGSHQAAQSKTQRSRHLKVAPLAMRVFRPPPKAEVEVRDAVPARVSFGGIRGAVVAASGPWRTAGDWWQHNPWQCDEWDVELEIVGRSVAGFYRLAHSLAFDTWFVRGEYD